VLLAAAMLATACDVQVGENGLSLDIAHGRAKDEWVRTYTLPANGTLEIVNVNGPIEATPAAGSQIEVRAEREVRTRTEEQSQALLQKLQMREEVSPDRVRIEAQGTREGGLRLRDQLSVAYHLRVPAGLTLSLRTENGGVRLENLSGRITASTTNGGITGRSLSGAVSAEVVNGGVQMDFTSLGGDVRLSTTNGGVRIDLPPDAKATVDATCVNGGIEVDERFKVQASEASRRRVIGMLNGGGPRISANTVNGGIRIRMRGPNQTD
jgi:hypothetical protein